MDQITVRAAFDQVKPVMDFVNAKLAELCCSEQVRVHVNVAIDEIFGNIVQYAYDPEGGPVTVSVEAHSLQRDPFGDFAGYESGSVELGAFPERLSA